MRDKEGVVVSCQFGLDWVCSVGFLGAAVSARVWCTGRALRRGEERREGGIPA